ncbi:MAG: methyltransferase domain-containing protein [Deltaproteobacteria bacterium]|nr:methyltransferase domain-containing protein [Deltaproteobacteria bacterium]
MGKIADKLFFRHHCLCPRWLCFTFDNGLRRLVQNPERITGHYIKEGDVVLDVGPGIGFFTIPMARIVGESGRVIAADIQKSMLEGIEKRARRAGVAGRIILHLSSPDSLGVATPADFVLAFWMAHEVPDQERFYRELHTVLKEDGRFLLVEPKIHVTASQFQTGVAKAQSAGFRLVEAPSIPLSYAALFAKL